MTRRPPRLAPQDGRDMNERGESFAEAWERYFAEHPRVLAAWGYHNGRWPEPTPKEDQ